MTTRNSVINIQSEFEDLKLKIDGLELLDYTQPENREIFGNAYHDILEYIHPYFIKLGFPQNEIIHLFMQHRMLSYFNRNDDICVCNEELILNIYPENKISINLSIDQLKSIIEKCKNVNGLVFISITINDFNIFSPETGPARHSNVFIINKKVKEFYAIEPNYGNIDINQNIQEIYNSLGNQLGFEYQGYLEQCNVSNHGNLCLFISVLSYFSNGDISYDLIKSEVIKYFRWELENIKNGILPCSKGVKFGNFKRENLKFVNLDIVYLINLKEKK